MESKIHESVFISNIISVGLSSVGCSSSSLGNGNLRLGKGISQIIAQAHLRSLHRLICEEVKILVGTCFVLSPFIHATILL